MRNPNEFYLPEEKEEIADELKDRAANAFLYLVVRTYRGKRRVLFISSSISEVETVYVREHEKLRDGDLAIWRIIRDSVIRCTSGGYNRTRW